MVLKNFFLLVVFFFFTFSSNSFANLQFKQSKDISTDTDHLRGIFIKPDGTRPVSYTHLTLPTTD